MNVCCHLVLHFFSSFNHVIPFHPELLCHVSPWVVFPSLSTSAVTEALMAPAQYPDCSGTRNLHDNLSDLRAQVAANQRGSQLVGELIDCYGLDVVQAYMGYIQVYGFV